MAVWSCSEIQELWIVKVRLGATVQHEVGNGSAVIPWDTESVVSQVWSDSRNRAIRRLWKVINKHKNA